MGKYWVDVIFVLSFGKPSTCKANWQIAKMAVESAKGILPVVVDSCVKIEGDYVFNVGSVDEEVHEATTTLIKEFLCLCRKNGWKNILVITADPYSKRVVRDIRKLGKNIPINARALRTDKYYWFYPDSNQIWTSEEYLWKIREWILMNLMTFRFYMWFTKKFA